MKRVFGILSFALLVASLFILPAAAEAPVLPGTYVQGAVSAQSPNLTSIARRINQERRAAGLQTLTIDPLLSQIAQARASDMANNNYYAHQSPTGEYYYDLMEDQNARPSYSCENLNLDTSTDPNIYVDGWLRSKNGHRECLLNAQILRLGLAEATIAGASTDGTPTDMTVVVAIHSTNL